MRSAAGIQDGFIQLLCARSSQIGRWLYRFVSVRFFTSCSFAPGGVLAGAVSYRRMFVFSVIIAAASLGRLRFSVREPRKMSAAVIPAEPLSQGEYQL